MDTLEAANMVNGQPHRAGTFIRGVTRVGDHYLITAQFQSARGGTSYDTLAVDARTLAPRWQRIHFATDSAAIGFTGNRVRGYSQRAGRPLRQIDRVLPANTSPTALIWHLMQAQGWRGSYVINEYDLWEDQVKRITYKPLGKARIRHRGKLTEVWVVQEDRGRADVLNGVPMIRMNWIDTARKRLVMRRDRSETTAKSDGYLLVAR